jgi:hypothetical protein
MCLREGGVAPESDIVSLLLLAFMLSLSPTTGVGFPL